ncbi:MAG: phosphoribosylpyrophosphate synthetase [Bacteroidetes bacterium]|nr:phosphoribosylpyrophosphate synthetase [Bacteroidota bacterium]
MGNYTDLVSGINDLKKQGYTEDFNLRENCLECRNGHFKLFHDEFQIDEWYRIEGDDSSAEGSSILYAISSAKHNLKGVLVNAYSIYSNSITNEMLSKLRT